MLLCQAMRSRQGPRDDSQHYEAHAVTIVDSAGWNMAKVRPVVMEVWYGMNLWCSHRRDTPCILVAYPDAIAWLPRLTGIVAGLPMGPSGSSPRVLALCVLEESQQLRTS